MVIGIFKRKLNSCRFIDKDFMKCDKLEKMKKNKGNITNQFLIFVALKFDWVVLVNCRRRLGFFSLII